MNEGTRQGNETDFHATMSLRRMFTLIYVVFPFLSRMNERRRNKELKNSTNEIVSHPLGPRDDESERIQTDTMQCIKTYAFDAVFSRLGISLH